MLATVQRYGITNAITNGTTECAGYELMPTAQILHDLRCCCQERDCMICAVAHSTEIAWFVLLTTLHILYDMRCCPYWRDIARPALLPTSQRLHDLRSCTYLNDRIISAVALAQKLHCCPHHRNCWICTVAHITETAGSALLPIFFFSIIVLVELKSLLFIFSSAAPQRTAYREVPSQKAAHLMTGSPL
jgi:hypothetical protein